MASHVMTTPQTARVDRLLAAWNDMRGDLRRQASREELIDFLLQREEDELQAMAFAEHYDAEPPALSEERAPYMLTDAPGFAALNAQLVENFTQRIDNNARALGGLGL